ncbi:sensor domain-containing phosphodiesterase [Pseudomonas sp. dw_358]|uniref:putative bifunctional diguanylate cyclase/phosphodiesterase n=1 Tax=Pseudomonas sp. dw_358 TaxID=2720083 RepID=UPI001BD6A0E9|nr:sensor domain-containing phosphodiesterase [Pseudomonas sp. dw_358]
MTPATRAQEQRLAALYALQLLDTASNECFDRICRLAAAYFKVPTVLISLVDRDRQWFLARVGFEASETPVEESMCATTIKGSGVLEVADARRDPRFRDLPSVTARDGVRFYAGTPLVTGSGHAIGSLCLIDVLPHQLSASERSLLADLGAMVMQQIEQRHAALRHDHVSGLPNREQFASDLQELAEDALGERRSLVVIDALDMTWAHELTLAMGIRPFEEIIRCIATRLKAQLGEVTRVYHIGVKRFAFLTPDQVQDFGLFIDTLIGSLRAPTIIDGLPIRPMVRAGSVDFMVNPQVLKDVVRKAMYAAELSLAARQSWSAYDAVQDAVHRRAFSLASDIGEAMVTEQLYLMFQPRFAIPDGSQVSAEALLRWEHPRLGPISPAEFIPVLEKNSLVHEVTRWVIDTAVGKLAGWPAACSTKLSLNLSPQDFEGHDITGVLKRACSRYDVGPERLEVEITEGEWLRSNPQVLKELAEIRGLGIDVAIDDFGTGYSNFSYLHEIPANVLKLDKSLVTELENDTRCQLIVSSIIDLSAKLGYRTVAEGMETFKCLQLLKSFGCDEAQGYFFSRPMVEYDFVAWSCASQFPLRRV